MKGLWYFWVYVNIIRSIFPGKCRHRVTAADWHWSRPSDASSLRSARRSAWSFSPPGPGVPPSPALMPPTTPFDTIHYGLCQLDGSECCGVASRVVHFLSQLKWVFLWGWLCDLLSCWSFRWGWSAFHVEIVHCFMSFWVGFLLHW